MRAFQIFWLLLLNLFPLKPVRASDLFGPDFSYQLNDEQLKPVKQKLKDILARLLVGAENLKKDLADPEERTKPSFNVDFDIDYHHSREIRANTPLVYQVEEDPVTKRKTLKLNVYRGLLSFVESEDELAGIIAHEMVHSKDGIDQNGVKLPLASNWLRRRANEFKADVLGAKIARAAGYDPRHVQNAIGRTAKLEKDTSELKRLEDLGMGFFRAAGASHPSPQERYVTMNGFLHFENRVAPLNRSLDNPYNGWLEKYKRALTAPWSKDEPNLGMQTFVERLLNLTDLRDRAPHEKIAFLEHILFDDPPYKNLFYHALMVDPQVNPNPIFNEINYDHSTGNFEMKNNRPFRRDFPSYGVPLPKSAPTAEYRSDVDGEYLISKTQELLSSNNDFNNKECKIAANRLLHSISANFEPRNNVLATIVDYGNQHKVRQNIRPFKAERILNLQNSILAAPSISNHNDFLKVKWQITPEQQVVALVKLAQETVNSARNPKGESTNSELSKVFNSIQEIPADFWPQKIADEYLKLLPKFHAAQFGTPESVKFINWPGMKYGQSSVSNFKTWDSAEKRCFNGNRNYLKNSMNNREVPLSVRMVAAHGLFDEKAARASYLPSIRSIGEYVGAYKGIDSLNTRVLNDESIFKTVLANPKWKADKDGVCQLLEKLDYKWLQEAGSGKTKRITGEVLGFNVDFEMKQPGLSDLKSQMAQFGYNDPEFESSLDKVESYLKNSSVQFDLKHSEKLQRELMARVERDNPKGLSLRDRADIHLALTQIGNTPYTDNMAERIYLDSNFRCADCIEKALDKGRVWDFSTRKRIFDRWLDIEGHPRFEKLPDNKARIAAFVPKLEHWFPEPSYERSAAVEDFSTHIESSYAEAKFLDPLKMPRDANNESAAARIFSAIRREMTGDPRYPRRPLEFVKFLTGSGPFPKMPNIKMTDSDRDGTYKVTDPHTGKPMKTKGFTHDVVGPDRIKKLFDSLSPGLKAGVLSYYLSPPQGILTNQKYAQEIKTQLISKVDSKYRQDAELLLEALLHAQQKVQPHEVPLTVGYLLAQSGGKSKSVGLILKDALVSQGAAGVSFGQKLYQRRMLPPDMLEDLADLQDKADPPGRLESYEQLIKKLDLKAPDAEVRLAGVLGSASAKVVLKVMRIDGEEAAWEAVKMLRPNFERSLEVQEEMLKEFVDYIEKDKRGRHRGLGPIFADTFASLRRQSDLRTEPRVKAQVEKLYLTGADGQKQIVDRHGYEWHVAQPKSEGASDHLREELVSGKTAKSLDNAGRMRIAPSLYDKEESILFKNLDSKNDSELIYFERDRHFGNYMVNANRITVIDYPLVSSISVAERRAVFNLLGTAELSKSFGSYLPESIKADLIKILKMTDANAGKTDPIKYTAAINEWLSKKDPKKSAGAQVFELFSALEKHGVNVKESVHSYLTALGHLEGVSHYLPREISGKGKLESVVSNIVRQELESKLKNINTFDKCRIAMSRLIRKN